MRSTEVSAFAGNSPLYRRSKTGEGLAGRQCGSNSLSSHHQLADFEPKDGRRVVSVLLGPNS